MIHFIAPVCNHAKTVGLFLDGLAVAMTSKKEKFRIIALDDASTDGSPEIIEQHGEKDSVRLIRFKDKRGLGTMLRIGLMNVSKTASDTDPVIIIEPEISNDYETVSAMLEKFRAGAEIVSASRFIPGGSFTGTPPLLHAFIPLSNFLLRSGFTLPNSTDYTYMLKLYKATVVKHAMKHFGDKLLNSAGAFAPAEFFIKSCLFTDSYEQVPARYDYSGSNSRGGKETIAELKEFMRLFRSCKKELEDYIDIKPE